MIWATSIWKLGCSNRSKIHSVQKCYLCLRYVVSPMSPGRTDLRWCRRGESNRRATLKTRKLLILQIARNAKTARNVFRGYAAATRKPRKGFHVGRNPWVRKNLFRVRRPTEGSYGPPFSQRNPAV